MPEYVLYRKKNKYNIVVLMGGTYISKKVSKN